MKMKYYSEGEMTHLRGIFEDLVLKWPHVQTKKMFGCPGYQVNGKLFAFLVTNGLVLTKLTPFDREKLSVQYETIPFQAGNRTVQRWIQVPLETKEDIEKTLPFIQISYTEAKEENNVV
jgi:hypothetical protein